MTNSPRKKPPPAKGYECPRCATRTEVHNSRTAAKGGIRRTRVCPACAFRFTTLETVQAISDRAREALLRAAQSHITAAIDTLDLYNAEHY